MLRLIFLLLFPFTVSSQLKRFEFSQTKMGSPFNLIFYHTDSSEALSIAKECYQIVDTLNSVFSDYSPGSEVGRLALQKNSRDIKVSAELFAMINYSKYAWEKSNKTFDITIGALSHLWRKAKAENRFPSETEVKEAKQLTGFKNLKIDLQKQTISFTKQGMQLDFGGIVKGYAAQKVISYLGTKNISVALADAGGDIAMSSSPPSKKGWIVGINLPEQEDELWNRKLELKNCAVATSGDVYRYIVNNGKKYSHIIDPKTGYGVTSQRNVTVIYKEGTAADWLATACSILPIKKALRLAKDVRAEVFIATLKNDRIVVYKTKGFDRYFEEKQQ